MTEPKLIFEKYFSQKHLILAWERMIRSNGKDIKDYFGIEVYATNLERNLSRLSVLLIEGNYKPQRPFKYYEPKASKTHRTKSILSVEDALVYQAIANSVATINYKHLEQNNHFVFGSVLHPEVQKGIELLDDEDPDYYFFEYYIPLYNKFINSINSEIENTNIQFKLETDITGFFDSIPHSKLLITLNKFGVEPEILDLLSECLNIYSGTKDSITPGVGIPQGPAASFFFANIFLSALDYEISQQGYTYFRYMDDIRIYEENEEELTEALVLIDHFLKGRALSLNTKKTSIQEIGEDRESERLFFLIGYDYDIERHPKQDTILKDVIRYVSDEGSNTDQDKKYILKTLQDLELIDFCKNEIQEVESYLFNKFIYIHNEDFNARHLTNDEDLKNKIINLAYRWRSSNAILNNIDVPILNEGLVEIWLFCLEHYFWKANHFCWNLNQYGSNDIIKSKLAKLIKQFTNYEWVRYQILSNLVNTQTFSFSTLREFFREAKQERSSLVRLGYYMILIKHLNINSQLYNSVKQAIKDDQEPYIKNKLSNFLTLSSETGVSETLTYWFGL